MSLGVEQFIEPGHQAVYARAHWCTKASRTLWLIPVHIVCDRRAVMQTTVLRMHAR